MRIESAGLARQHKSSGCSRKDVRAYHRLYYEYTAAAAVQTGLLVFSARGVSFSVSSTVNFRQQRAHQPRRDRLTYGSRGVDGVLTVAGRTRASCLKRAPQGGERERAMCHTNASLGGKKPTKSCEPAGFHD